jgi:undecaprenyl pyrophosphate phosphatase UppP
MNSTDQASVTTNEFRERLRREPIKHIAIALVAGFVLSLFPIRRILVLIVRTALLLIKPTLMILGAIKLCEYFNDRSSSPLTKTQAL